MTLAVVLACIAWASPASQGPTDRTIYEATANLGVVPDCSEIHCFRVLVPWALGVLPGGSDAKWKLHAAVSNAAAAVAVLELTMACGIGATAATMAMLLSAFGFGSLYTLHDPFTADPLMYLLGPLMTLQMLRGQVSAAGVVGMLGVFAKEFAAAPLVIFCVFAAWCRDFGLALRVLAWANLAVIAWLVLQLTLTIRFNYSYGDNPSTDLAGGGYLMHWLARESPRGALSALFNEFGALYLLAPVGLMLGPQPLRRLALVSLPVAVVFAYVQQPDRALWNFHFLVIPLAAVVLDRAPALVGWSLAGCFAFSNLRIGAQIPWIPAARYAVLASVALAVVAIVSAVRSQGGPAVQPRTVSA